MWQETMRKALIVRPEGLNCFTVNGFLCMIMLRTSSSAEFNCRTLQTSEWWVCPGTTQDALGRSVLRQVLAFLVS